MRTATLLLAATLAGCAATPQTPTATPAPAPVAAAKAASAAPGTRPPPPGGISADLYSKSLQYGYRARQRSGTTIFCKNDAPIGSRLEKETCVSVDSLEEAIRQAEMVRDQMRRGNSCGKADCSNGG